MRLHLKNKEVAMYMQLTLDEGSKLFEIYKKNSETNSLHAVNELD